MKQKCNKSISETVTLKCRVCQKEMLRKNYKLHLKVVHGSQNSEDLTPFGQSKKTKITDMFQSKTHIPKEATEDLVRKTIESDDIESESRDYDRKRKHESVDSGVGKDLRCPVSKKVREVPDDSEKAPNNDLNEKLDKI